MPRLRHQFPAPDVDNPASSLIGPLLRLCSTVYGLKASPLSSFRARFTRWAERLEAYRADEALARRFRARQLQAVLRLTPLAMLANLLNASLVTLAFWPGDAQRFLLLWDACVLLFVLNGLRAWWRQRRGPPRHTASPRAIRQATLHAALLAAVWAAMPLALFSGATSEQQLLVATVTTGMICAGGFALATLPLAGTAYVVVLGVGATVSLALSGLAVAPLIGGLLLVYGMIVIGSVWSTARLFGSRLMAEAEAERQNEVIGLLLRDFEENASDLLWEIGADGRLRHVSPRLAEHFGLSAQALASAPVLDILHRLMPDDDDARAHLRALRACFQQGAPFRDQPLAVERNGRTRWWSLSAKPLVDEQGHQRGWRGVASDITAARLATRQLTWLAQNDALTGLANRHQFRTRLAALLATEPTPALAVLCLDLDHFKAVNDTLGHGVGDSLLQAVSARLLSGTRRHDTVARLGGDEFAILLHADDRHEVAALTQRLLDALSQACNVGQTRLTVRASIGIAIAPQHGLDVDTLLTHADLALYAAKAAGRNEYRFFTPEMAASTRRRVAVEQRLRSALHNGALRLVFQPQADLADWRIVGFEALLRWQDAELGEVSPAEFIPVAEDAGLMPAIGDWVLAHACQQAAGWPADHVVSVNVSPVQAMAPDFADRVLRHARAAGLPPARLELEITESVFLDETQASGQATGKALLSLRRAGVRVALDDFGTGYSALAYLRRFPFDTLKIDRSFVRELLTRSDAREIVKMIVALARTLRMRTVAEGVEEPAHVAVLQQYGCTLMQGFLVSRPLPADQVPDFLAGWPSRPRPHLEEPTATAAMPLNSHF